MGEVLHRLAAIRQDLAVHDLDALIVGQPENRRYLTGFTGSSGLAVVTPTEARLLTDSRYYGQVAIEAPHFHLEKVRDRIAEPLAQLLVDLRINRVGFEADTVTVSELERFQAAVTEVDWVSTSGLVEGHRAVKSDAEVKKLRHAADLTDQAMAHAVHTARPGMTEKALAWAIEVYMRENGAESMAFETIVASGENSALPHYRPGNHVIEAGEPLMIDMGARLEGYCGDLTRTFSLGPSRDEEYERVYAVVDEANRAATDGIRAGMTGPEADRLARDVIEAAGYGEHFGHGLGHGVGLNVHELPRLGRTADGEPLAPGMVTTIEPGIYLPGRFGVRIEDVVIVGNDGVEVVTQAPKQPVVEAGIR